MIDFLLHLIAKMLMVIRRLWANIFDDLSDYRIKREPPKLSKPKEEKTMLFFMKERLRMRALIETQGLTLKNKESDFDITLKQREAEFTQKLKDQEADFSRRILTQQNDFKIKESNLKDEFDRNKKMLEETTKLEVDKVTTLAKLESEQKVAKIQLEADKRVAAVENEKVKAVADLEKRNAEAISQVKQQEAQQHYDRMTKAMAEMNQNGSVHTKNLHEMTMTLLQHARPGVNESRFLTGRIDGQEGPLPKTIITDGKTVNAAVVSE